MSRNCPITGKQVMVGNNVSHANNKTKKRYKPNLQSTSVYSDVLGERVRMKMSTNGLRTLTKMGGLDKFLLDTAKTKLPKKLRRLKKRVEEAYADGPPAELEMVE